MSISRLDPFTSSQSSGEAPLVKIGTERKFANTRVCSERVDKNILKLNYIVIFYKYEKCLFSISKSM